MTGKIKAFKVEKFAVLPNPEIEVRPCRKARGADVANLLALLDLLADLHLSAGEVHVIGFETVRVLEFDEIPSAAGSAGKGDGTRRDGLNGCPGRSCVVDAQVGTARLQYRMQPVSRESGTDPSGEFQRRSQKGALGALAIA